MYLIARTVERSSRFLAMLMVALGLVGLAQQGAHGAEHLAICLSAAAAAWIAGYGARALRPAPAEPPAPSQAD